MFPIVMRNLVKSIYEVVVAKFNCQFAPVVEATGSKVDGAYNGAHPIAEQHLAMEFEVPELMNFDADVVHDAQTAHAFDELVFLERVWRPGHDMDFDAAFPGAN